MTGPVTQSPEELLQLVDAYRALGHRHMREVDAYRALDHRHMRERDAYRDALTDLIAELRDEHRIDSGGYCETCDVERWPCPSARAADWAEARLHEIGGGDE